MFDHVIALASCVGHFPQIAEKLIIRAWCATVSSAAVFPSIHKLSDVDMNQHCDACHALLNTLPNTTSCLKGALMDA